MSARFRSVFAAGFQVTIYRKEVFYLAPKDCAATYHTLEPPTQYTAYFIFCILENQLLHMRAQQLIDWEIPIWVQQAQGAQTQQTVLGKSTGSLWGCFINQQHLKAFLLENGDIKLVRCSQL